MGLEKGTGRSWEFLGPAPGRRRAWEGLRAMSPLVLGFCLPPFPFDGGPRPTQPAAREHQKQVKDTVRGRAGGFRGASTRLGHGGQPEGRPRPTPLVPPCSEPSTRPGPWSRPGSGLSRGAPLGPTVLGGPGFAESSGAGSPAVYRPGPGSGGPEPGLGDLEFLGVHPQPGPKGTFESTGRKVRHKVCTRCGARATRFGARFGVKFFNSSLCTAVAVFRA
jgi:hypothetical protein